MQLRTLFLICLLALGGCASQEKREPKASANLIGEDYFIDNGMPIREVKKEQEFFFKKCNVDNRGAYPAKTNYDCNEP